MYGIYGIVVSSNDCKYSITLGFFAAADVPFWAIFNATSFFETSDCKP